MGFLEGEQGLAGIRVHLPGGHLAQLGGLTDSADGVLADPGLDLATSDLGIPGTATARAGILHSALDMELPIADPRGTSGDQRGPGVEAIAGLLCMTRGAGAAWATPGIRRTVMTRRTMIPATRIGIRRKTTGEATETSSAAW